MKGFQRVLRAHILRGWLFLRPGFHEHVFEAKIEKKFEVTGGHGGRLRPFEVKVKLWVSKFIFFHADSGIGLKHNFEAVFEAVRGRFVI